jgi:hypothetical protein
MRQKEIVFFSAIIRGEGREVASKLSQQRGSPQQYVPIAETTQSEHHKGDHRYGIKQAAGYARIVPSPTTTASPPT